MRGGIYLALRQTAASSATRLQRTVCAGVRWRLVSDYCHGGIISDGVLYHSTIQRGLHSTTDFEPEKWDLILLPAHLKPRFMAVYERFEGAKYDWFSQFAFVIPARFSDSTRLYCFEFCAEVLGLDTRYRITPEDCLRAALKHWQPYFPKLENFKPLAGSSILVPA